MVNSSAMSLLYIKFGEEFPQWEAKTKYVVALELPYIKGVGHSSYHKQGGKPSWSRGTEDFLRFLFQVHAYGAS